jgi:hypothetical protein
VNVRALALALATGAGAGAGATALVTSGARESITVALGDTIQPRFSVKTDSVLKVVGSKIVAAKCGDSFIYLRNWKGTTQLSADTVAVHVLCPTQDTTIATLQLFTRFVSMGGKLVGIMDSSFRVGQSRCIYAVAKNAAGEVLTGKPVTFTSSNTNVVTIGPGCPDTTVSPSLSLGRMALAVRISDNFSRADGGLGANWLTSPITDGDLSLVSNEAAVATIAGIAAQYYDQTLPDDQWAEVELRTIGTGVDNGAGVIVRGNGGDFYLVQSSQSETRLYKRVSGSFTQIGPDGPAGSTGNRLRLEAHADQLSVFLNNSLIIGPETDASIASGKAGLWGTNPGTPTLDNFLAGSFGVAPAGTPNSANSTTPVSITLGTLVDGLLVVSISHWHTGPSQASVTYNGVAMTRAAEQGVNHGGTGLNRVVTIFELPVGSGDAVARNLAISFDAGVSEYEVLVDRYEGVDQTTPVGAAVTGTGATTTAGVTATLSVPTTSDGSLVAAISGSAGLGLYTATQTLRIAAETGVSATGAAQQTAVGTGSNVTLGWGSVASLPYAQAALPLLAAGGGGGGGGVVQRRTLGRLGTRVGSRQAH